MSTLLGKNDFTNTIPSRQASRWSKDLKRRGIIGLITLGIFYSIDTFIISTTPIHGPSMSPAINARFHEKGQRDTLIYLRNSSLNNLLSLTSKPIQRGDVVLLLKPHDPLGRTVKRVLGLPGDLVKRDYRMVKRGDTNGKRFGFGKVPAEVRVPVGHVFVEGDNWRNSLDSNDFGTVSQRLIVGKPIGRADSFWKAITGRWERLPDRSNAIRGVNSRTLIIPGKVVDEDEWEKLLYS